MAAPVAVRLGEFAYGNCEYFVGKAKEVKEARDQLFKTKNNVQKAAYYIFTAISVASMVAMPICVAVAAINVSFVYLGYAGLATAALFGFSWLSGRFNSMSNEETQIYKRFKNPLGLDNNRDSVPEASSLKGDRAYFENLVAEKKTDKEKESQKKDLLVAEKLFDKKIDKVDLKQRVATLATTSLILEAIQLVFKQEQKQAVEILNKIEEGKLLESSSFNQRDRIRGMIVELKRPSPLLKEKLKVEIASEKGNAVFKMSDLDKVLDLAERYPNVNLNQNPQVNVAR